MDTGTTMHTTFFVEQARYCLTRKTTDRQRRRPRSRSALPGIPVLEVWRGTVSNVQTLRESPLTVFRSDTDGAIIGVRIPLFPASQLELEAGTVSLPTLFNAVLKAGEQFKKTTQTYALINRLRESEKEISEFLTTSNLSVTLE